METLMESEGNAPRRMHDVSPGALEMVGSNWPSVPLQPCANTLNVILPTSRWKGNQCDMLVC